jgi:signal recognition particle subunit SRP72
LAAVIANLSIEGSVSDSIKNHYVHFSHSILQQKKELPNLRESSYELVYNAACRLLGNEQLQDAEKKLKLSEKMCRETLEEDGTAEEEIEDELGIVK